jgi:ribosomal protein S18 acetylase RimI-like enzyme
MTTSVRSAEAADVGGLIALSRRTICASYRPFLGDEAVDAFLGSGAVEQYVTENLGRCTVLVREGQVVGYAVCRDDLIDLLMIDQGVQRQGLGTELLAHVEGSLFRSYGALRLESFEGNRPANAFYQKHGWREVGRHLDRDSGARKIVFRKSR